MVKCAGDLHPIPGLAPKLLKGHEFFHISDELLAVYVFEDLWEASPMFMGKKDQIVHAPRVSSRTHRRVIIEAPERPLKLLTEPPSVLKRLLPNSAYFASGSEAAMSTI